MTTATAETSSMAPAKNLPEVAVPVEESPAVQQTAVPASRGAQRRRRSTKAKADVGPAPLSHAEFAQLGALLARARANGQEVTDYVEDLRGELAAWERLLILEGADA